MEDFNVDQILAVMNNPESKGLMESTSEALDKINIIMEKFDKTVVMLDRMGIKPLIVRAAGQKLGVDVDTPLQAEKIIVEKDVGSAPASGYHKVVFDQLNQLDEKELAIFITDASQVKEVEQIEEHTESSGQDSSTE